MNLFSLWTLAEKCFDEKECYRNKIKRWCVFLKRPKGKIVCPPVHDWEVCAATVQRGMPIYGRIGMELVHERCPENEKRIKRFNNLTIFSHFVQETSSV